MDTGWTIAHRRLSRGVRAFARLDLARERRVIVATRAHSDPVGCVRAIGVGRQRAIHGLVSKSFDPDIWQLPLGGASSKATAVLATPADEFDGIASPDGHWLAFASASSGSPQVRVGARPTRLRRSN